MRRHPSAKGNLSSSMKMTVPGQLSTDSLCGHFSTDLSKRLQKQTERASKFSSCPIDMKLEGRLAQVSVPSLTTMMLRLLFDELRLLEKDIWNIWPHGATQKRVSLFCHWLCKTPQQLYGPGKCWIKWLSLETWRGRWVLHRHLLSKSSQGLTLYMLL